jgi:hypothetical protein
VPNIYLTVFPHIRPVGIIILFSLQMRVLLENNTFLLHKVIRIAGIIRVAGTIRGRVLYEEIRYVKSIETYTRAFLTLTIISIGTVKHSSPQLLLLQLLVAKASAQCARQQKKIFIKFLTKVYFL